MILLFLINLQILWYIQFLKSTPYSLLDEIRFHFGEDANLIHRIDAETSGLVIVGKIKKLKLL